MSKTRDASCLETPPAEGRLGDRTGHRAAPQRCRGWGEPLPHCRQDPGVGWSPQGDGAHPCQTLLGREPSLAAITDTRPGAKVTKLYTGETRKQPLGTAPPGMGGVGQAGPAAPAPWQPLGKHGVKEPGQGGPARPPRPRASAPPNRALSPGEMPGAGPVAPGTVTVVQSCSSSRLCLRLPGDWVSPHSSAASPGLSRPQRSQPSPSGPDAGAPVAPAHCSTQTSLSSSSLPAASPSGSGTAGTSSTATTFSRSSISRSRLSLGGRLLR